MPSVLKPLDTYIYLLVFFFGAGVIIPMVPGYFIRRRHAITHLALGLASAGSLVTIACAIRAWQHPLNSSHFFAFTPMAGMLPGKMPEIAFIFYADRLAAFFLLLTGVFTLAVALHLVTSLENLPDRHRIAAVFNGFVLAIVLTVLSDTVYAFLLFQECMTLWFAYLALFRHNTYLEKEDVSIHDLEASKLAFKSYLIFEHVGIMLVAIALLLLSVAGGLNNPQAFDFSYFREQAAKGPSGPLLPSIIFLLALAGFGIKAGVFPAHIWVPMVHPYSPTSIHAMMSGIALKVAGLYGMYRVFFYFLTPDQWWWGWLVLLLSGATALFGVFYAILGKDLKTALASHSVENIGIILAGIGLALIFYAESRVSFPDDSTFKAYESLQHSYLSGLAGLALIASLYHLVNHSVFKGLLFFCTGAIENRLSVMALDRLGGLMKRYPLTSMTFLIGAVSIAGFPPFNGFISEWLLLQTLFAGMGVYSSYNRVILLIGLVTVLFCLALAFSLTALAFVKIVGETLLGAPRDPYVAKNARPGEVNWPMRVVLIAFSALCLLLGVLPALVAQLLSQPAADMVAGFGTGNLTMTTPGNNIMLNISMIAPRAFGTMNAEWSAAPTSVYQTRLSGLMLLALGLILAYAIAFGMLVVGSRRAVQTGAPWTCGVPFFDRLMQYTGAAFASIIWRPFEARPFTNPDDPLYADKQESLPYRETVTQQRHVIEVTRRGYNALITRLLAGCEKIGAFAQPGDIRVYLQYIFILFISILIFLLLTQTGGG